MLSQHSINNLYVQYNGLVRQLNALKPTVRRARDVLLATYYGGPKATRSRILEKYSLEQLRNILKGYVNMERERVKLRKNITQSRQRRVADGPRIRGP